MGRLASRTHRQDRGAARFSSQPTGGDRNGVLQEGPSRLHRACLQRSLGPCHFRNIDASLVLGGQRVANLLQRRVDADMTRVVREVPEGLLHQDVPDRRLPCAVSPG